MRFQLLVLILISLTFFAPSLGAQENKAQRPFEFFQMMESHWSGCLSSDGKKLFIGAMPRFLEGGWRQWDVPDKKIVHTHWMKYGNANVMALSPDNRKLAVGGNNFELAIYDVETGMKQCDLVGHRASFNGLCFSPDGKHLVSFAADNMVRVWQTNDGGAVATYQFTSGIPQLDLWKAGEPVQTKAKITVAFPNQIKRLQRCAVSSDSKYLVVATADNEVLVLELLTGQAVGTIVLKSIQQGVTFAFSPDGSLLAIGGGPKDGLIEMWDFAKRKHLQTLTKHDKTVLCLAISADNKTLVSGGLSDGVRVWDLATGKEKYQKFHDPEVFGVRTVAVAFMPGGDQFMYLFASSPAQFVDTDTGKVSAPRFGKKQP